jgi:caa(3)-type oxidase subunit IV
MSKAFLIKIWVILLMALAVSLALAGLNHPALATSLIFAIAIVKAFLVLWYYMGLKNEPGYVGWILMTGLVFMMVLFVGLVPDMIYVYGV